MGRTFSSNESCLLLLFYLLSLTGGSEEGPNPRPFTSPSFLSSSCRHLERGKEEGSNPWPSTSLPPLFPRNVGVYLDVGRYVICLSLSSSLSLPPFLSLTPSFYLSSALYFVKRPFCPNNDDFILFIFKGILKPMRLFDKLLKKITSTKRHIRNKKIIIKITFTV